MSDVFTKKKRSEVMSHIKGSGNRETEIAMILILRSHRISGWRRNQRVFGKPDFIFPQQKVAVFVDGCFWHGCPQHSNMPRNNRAFWQKKLGANKNRDKLVTRELRKQHWTVLRIWEHELRQPDKIARRVAQALSKPNPSVEL